MALDEATSALLQQMSAGGGKPLHEMTIEEARELTLQATQMIPKGPDMVKVTNGRVTVDGGFVPFRMLYPVEKPVGLIVYYHGGGWAIGDLDQSESLGRVLANDTGCAVMLVDYRKAPEYRFPTAANDSYDAFLYAAELAETIADKPVPVIVFGDSAGGTLAAVIAQRAKRKNGPAIALQVLVYPATDCDLNTVSYTNPENQLLLTRDGMKWFWDLYAPDPTSRTHPDASPLREQDLSGLPPAVIVTPEYDVLRDEAELYATFLVQAGVPVDLFRVPGQLHGFFALVNVLPGSKIAMDYIAEAIHKTIKNAG